MGVNMRICRTIYHTHEWAWTDHMYGMFAPFSPPPVPMCAAQLEHCNLLLSLRYACTYIRTYIHVAYIYIYVCVHIFRFTCICLFLYAYMRLHMRMIAYVYIPVP